MSDINVHADPEVYMACMNGLEFCNDPQCRDIEGCVSCDYIHA